MRLLATEQLRGETYLEDPNAGITIENIVESEIMPRFENDVKRYFDLSDSPDTNSYTFRIRGLKKNLLNHMLKQNVFSLSYADMLKIF
jgi:hypothetical protein